jgi:hypothetical protein
LYIFAGKQILTKDTHNNDMKNKRDHFVHTLTAFTTLLTLSTSAVAQTIPSSNWNELVNSSDNKKTETCIRLQTFDNEKTDNWEYKGGLYHPDLSYINEETNKPTVDDKLGTSGGVLLRDKEVLKMDDITGYSNIKYIICAGGLDLPSNSTLKAITYIDNVPNEEILFSLTKKQDALQASYFDLTNKPSRLELSATTNTSDYAQFFFVKYIKAMTETYKYSLFTGEGDWNSDKWSNGIATGETVALIQGNVIVTTTISCDNVALGDGAVLNINPGGELKVKRLEIFTSQPNIHNQGSIEISEKLVINKDFEEKGKWYMVSFPFDVRKSDITNLTQGDNSTTGIGDYFYVYEYDGEKRANAQKVGGNWKIKEITTNDNDLIFEKNKGYLVAIDEGASVNTLTISHNGPMTLPKAETIDVQFPSVDGIASDNKHFGWYLCGNPLFQNITPSALTTNDMFDGTIYWYNGTDFEPLTHQSQRQIPFMGAFFVKVKGTTGITATQSEYQGTTSPLAIACYSIDNYKEPSINSGTKTSHNILANIRTTDNKLYISDLKESATLSVYSDKGQLLFNTNLAEKSHEIDIDFIKDSYLVVLKTKDKTQSIKVVRL